MNTIKEALYRHFELGYARQLFWVDSFFLFAIIVDVFTYAFVLGLPLTGRKVWQIDLPNLENSFLNILQFVLFLLVIVPVVITVLRVLGWSATFLKRPFATSQMRVLCLHALFCIFFVYSFLVIKNMQTVSGWEEIGNEVYVYSLHSYFASLVASPALKAIFGSTNTLISLAVTGILSYVLLGTRPSKAFNQYLVRASLADLSPQFRPVKRSGRFDTPNPSTLARINFSIEYATRVLREYQDLGPGTDQATRYLDFRYSECVGTMTDKLLRTPSPGARGLPIGMNLFSGTKSAFQATLARVQGRKEVVVSPYASASLSSFLQWHCGMTGDDCRLLMFSPEDYCGTWGRQQDKMLSQLVDGKSEAPDRTLVLVVSEVFYGSGLRLPLKAFLQNVRRAIPLKKLHIIVDGTNAVGNRRIVSVDPEWDSYIFSPHKWLMATESCGIVLSPSDAPPLESPSSWHVGSRKKDIMVRILAGLRGSMELLRTPGLEYFLSRCEKLRAQFKLSLPHSIQVVGDQAGLDETYVFSCFPALRHNWKFNGAELEERIVTNGLNASVFMRDDIVPWVRVAIPYYLDVREITRLCDFLDEVVR